MARGKFTHIGRSVLSNRVIVLAILLGMIAPLHARADAARDQAWRDDLRFFAEQIRKVHPKPFAHVTEARFDSAVAALDQRIATLGDAAVAIGFMRLDRALQEKRSNSMGTSTRRDACWSS